MRSTVLAVAVLGCAWGCGSSGAPTSPGKSVPAPMAPGTTGTLTWTEIRATRPLCAEITRQVGTSYPLWFKYEEDRPSVVLSFSHEGPVENLDPMADPPEIFTGSIDGNVITASFTGYPGAFACPGDGSATPQTGGALKATIASGVMEGEIADIYGTGDAQVTMVFRFRVAFAPR